MRSVHDYLVNPDGKRYNNTSESGLILNTEMQNHNYVNRVAIVLSCPVLGNKAGISPGDKLLIHHNVFRRFYDVRGNEKNSKSYFDEDTYFCSDDQVYMVDKGNGWESLPGFTFVQPIKEMRELQDGKEFPLLGIVAYPDKEQPEVKVDDIISFEPGSEFEFEVDNKKVYRILSNSITINHGRKQNEIAYNSRGRNSSSRAN